MSDNAENHWAKAIQFTVSIVMVIMLGVCVSIKENEIWPFVSACIFVAGCFGWFMLKTELLVMKVNKIKKALDK